MRAGVKGFVSGRARRFFDGQWSAEHPGRAAAALLLLAAAAALALSRGPGWDTDILRLLPADMPAVSGLAMYQREFPQSRELAFLIEWSGPAEEGSRVRDEFVEALRGEEWAGRILDGGMLAGSATGKGEMGVLAALALNRPEGLPEGSLDARRVAERLERLAARAAAGSPAAAAELAADPLGVFGPAAAEAARALDLEGVFDLEAPDGRAWIVPVAAKLPGLGEQECRELMDKVRDFLRRFEGRFAGQGPLKVGVTGRAAYVAEVAAAMRRDFLLTSVVSAALVLGIFWAGYRTLRPLAGTGLLLALSAALTLAAGFLLLGPLNLVAVSFCSILFGLGDDFSLLICQRHAAEMARGRGAREAAGLAARGAAPGIRAVALTTGIGFLALGLSGSAGFAQLGVMVALGVGICALLMPAFFGLFLLGARPLHGGGGLTRRWVAWCGARRRGWGALLPGASVFAAACLASWFLPGFPKFDLSPRSLEPRETPAARTLEAMMRRFPAMFEPVMVVVPEAKVEDMERLDRSLAGAREAGWIERASSPSPLLLDPARLAANAPDETRLAEALAAGLAAAQELGLGRKVEDALRGQAAALAHASSGGKDWAALLGEDSPWWFVLDRMLASDGRSVVAYLRVGPDSPAAERAKLAQFLEERVPGSLVTGWSQLLASLVPWARRQLLVFGGGVLVVVLIVLALVYRKAMDWLWHVAAMGVAGAGLLATLKLLDVPINLLNVLAFPLILGVGVDYGTHLLLAARHGAREVAGTLRAVTFSALTTAGGFGALTFAQSPALAGLGFLCAAGVLWCLASAFLILVPGSVFARGSRDG